MCHKLKAILFSLFLLIFNSLPTYSQGVSVTNSGGVSTFASTNTTISVIPGSVATYRSSTGWITPASATTDIATLVGSSTKTIHVIEVLVAYQISNSGDTDQTNIYLIKRSTADTAGTSLTAVPLDSNNAAATATPYSYTSNPSSLGTAVGTMVTGVISSAFGASLAGGLPLNEFSYSKIFDAHLFGQALTLHGTSENIAVNFNGTIPPGGSPLVSVMITWTEQ